MFSGKVTFLGFFRLVYRIKVASLPCRNHRFAVSKSPVYRVEIVAGLPCQSRRVTDLPCRSRQFAVSKSFSVSKLPVCHVKVTGENEIKSDKNKKKHLQIKSK